MMIEGPSSRKALASVRAADRAGQSNSTPLGQHPAVYFLSLNFLSDGRSDKNLKYLLIASSRYPSDITKTEGR